jgi:hypothetical protein
MTMIEPAARGTKAFVATLAFWDGRQEPMQPLRTIYMGRMPETIHEGPRPATNFRPR